MSLGTKRGREPELCKLTVRGNVNVHVSKTFVAARNAKVVRDDAQIEIGDIPPLPQAAPRTHGARAPASSVDWGRRSKTVPSDPRTQVALGPGELIGEITAFGKARIVITDVDLLHNDLLLSVFDEASVALPKGYLPAVHAVVGGKGSIAAPNARDCLWAATATIKASDSGSVRGLKVMNSLTATADERAEVSLIVAKDAETRHTGPVQIMRTK